MKTMTLSLSDDLMQAVENEARKTGQTPGQVINRVLREAFLEKPERVFRWVIVAGELQQGWIWTAEIRSSRGWKAGLDPVKNPGQPREWCFSVFVPFGLAEEIFFSRRLLGRALQLGTFLGEPDPPQALNVGLIKGEAPRRLSLAPQDRSALLHAPQQLVK